MSRLATWTALIITTSVSLSAMAETRHTVILGGNKAGIQTSSVGADGVREVKFEFNDRGRGPKITSRFKLNEAGLPVSVQTGGNNYLKVAVNETFTLDQGVARWKNDAESGERKLTAPAFYISLNSPPEEAALLANALLKASERKLDLLPEGRATLRKSDETTLQSSAGERHVISYEITGLGFTPQVVWLDEDGGFFAAVDSWSAFIREGWEESAPKLLELQNTRAHARTLETARALTRQPKGGTFAIVNANLFDSQTGKSAPGSTVLVEGNRIKAVGADGKVTIPSGAERIDARGRALLPGLADMHVHMSADDGVQHMAAGVTTVRDMAGDTDALLAMKRRVEAGEEIGPRIFMMGILDGPAPLPARPQCWSTPKPRSTMPSITTPSLATRA